MSQEKQHTSVAYSLWKWKQFMHEIHVSIVTGHYIAYWLERVYDHLSDPGFLKPLKVIFDGLNVSVYLLFPLRRQRLSKKVEDQRFSLSPSVMTFWFCIQFWKRSFNLSLMMFKKVKFICCSQSVQLGGTYTMQIPYTVNILFVGCFLS